MDHTKTITKVLGEGTAVDYKKLAELFKEKRFMAYKKGVIDIVAKILLAAANNGEEFFKVCEWAKRAKLASKPTFSRRKKFLQKVGVLGNDGKIPTKFGRPRVRLKLDKKRFEEVYGIKL